MDEKRVSFAEDKTEYTASNRESTDKKTFLQTSTPFVAGPRPSLNHYELNGSLFEGGKSSCLEEVSSLAEQTNYEESESSHANFNVGFIQSSATSGADSTNSDGDLQVEDNSKSGTHSTETESCAKYEVAERAQLEAIMEEVESAMVTDPEDDIAVPHETADNTKLNVNDIKMETEMTDTGVSETQTHTKKAETCISETPILTEKTETGVRETQTHTETEINKTQTCTENTETQTHINPETNGTQTHTEKTETNETQIHTENESNKTQTCTEKAETQTHTEPETNETQIHTETDETQTHTAEQAGTSATSHETQQQAHQCKSDSIYLETAAPKPSGRPKRKRLTKAEQSTMETLASFGGSDLGSVLRKNETFEDRLAKDRLATQDSEEEPQRKKTRLELAKEEANLAFRDIPFGEQEKPATRNRRAIQDSKEEPQRRKTRLELAKEEANLAFRDIPFGKQEEPAAKNRRATQDNEQKPQRRKTRLELAKEEANLAFRDIPFGKPEEPATRNRRETQDSEEEPLRKKTRLELAKEEANLAFRDIPFGKQEEPAMSTVAPAAVKESTGGSRKLTRLERARLEVLQSFGGSEFDDLFKDPKKKKEVPEEENDEDRKENKLVEPVSETS